MRVGWVDRLFMVNMTGGKQTSVNVRFMRLFWSRVWWRAGVSGHLEKTCCSVHYFLDSCARMSSERSARQAGIKVLS